MNQPDTNRQPVPPYQPIDDDQANNETPIVKGKIKPKMKMILLIAIPLILVCAATVVILLIISKPATITLDTTKATTEGKKYVIDANNKFAFSILPEINKSDSSNVFYSPYSISSALAMTYEGAKGKTADEMKSVFNFPASSVLRNNFAAIYSDLNKENENYKLNTGNALWVQQDFPLLSDYKDKISKFYGGKSTNLDFINNTENSRKTINDYISEQTNNKINDLIEPPLSKGTRLILTNAIYFYSKWETPFDGHTEKDDFKVTPTNTIQTDMMSMESENRFNYIDTGNMQIIELPYKGEKLSMLIMLPKNDLDSIKSDLNSSKINEYKSRMTKTDINTVMVPKFEFDSKYSLNNTLSALGMPTAFSSSQADFSGITGIKDLYINQVVHQAYVKVNESGTEAAAATATGMGITSAAVDETPKIDFIANHPFIFMIQENKTGNILFLGKMVNPSK